MTLPKLNPNTPTLMDGEVRLFKRKHSSVWQVVFMMDGRQVRVSTKKRILKDAKDAAREIYLDYRFRQKNGLPVISKRFAVQEQDKIARYIAYAIPMPHFLF
jgi:hypothetical protein